MAQAKNLCSWQSFLCLHLKLLDLGDPLTFEVSKLRPIEAHALIYLSARDDLVTVRSEEPERQPFAGYKSMNEF